MKIESIRIENFRSFKDQLILFDNYNCFVGANGSGKSTVLQALNLFFRQYKDTGTDLSRLSEHDFHHKNTNKEIRITVTFKDLSDEAKRALSAYVRLDKLIVTCVAKYNSATQRAEVTQLGNRLAISDFAEWFERKKSSALAPELQAIYTALRSKYPDLPTAKTKADMEEALNSYEQSHPEDCILIPSEDQFYGVSKGVNKLSPFIQWVFVSASKDATSEAEETKTSALGQLLDRAVRNRVNFSEKVTALRSKLVADYQKMLDAEQNTLLELSKSLEERLQLWSNPSAKAKIEWKQDPDRTIKVEEPWAHVLIGEKGFDGELARFGHGMQRSFLLSVLQELAASGSSGPTLVMAIEEPELYQHPPQAKYLSETIQDLAQQGSQILACSHSPYFIPGDNFSSVRVIREVGDPCESEVSSASYESISKRLHDAGEKLIKESGMLAKLYPILRPEINEIFFCKRLILVEGIEDVAHISTYLELTTWVSKFREQGWHIVPVGGKSELARPICIAQALKIPVYVVLDNDKNKEDAELIKKLSESDDANDQEKLKRINSEIAQHQKENTCILKLMNQDENLYWEDRNLHLKNMTIWSGNMTLTIEKDLGDKLDIYRNKASAIYGNAKGLKKNPLAIAKTLQMAWEENAVSSSLILLLEDIFQINSPSSQLTNPV